MCREKGLVNLMFEETLWVTVFLIWPNDLTVAVGQRLPKSFLFVLFLLLLGEEKNNKSGSWLAFGVKPSKLIYWAEVGLKF